MVRRSLESFIFALVLLRITGHKTISQLNYFDFLAINMVGGLLSSYITDPDQDLEILLAPVAIVAADLIAGRLAIRSRSARRLLEGRPIIFIRDGRMIERNIAKMRYNVDELLAALRNKGIYNLNNIEFAVLEVDGNISVLEKSQYKAATVKDFNIPTKYEGLPSLVISDGKIITKNLQKNSLNHEWLENKLKGQGINDMSSVFLASLNPDGSLYIDLKDS